MRARAHAGKLPILRLFKVENSDFKVMRAIAHAHLCDYNASLTTVVFRYQELEEDVVTNAEDIEEWCQKDVDARTFIYSTINNDQQCSLHGCKTAAEMWTRITTEYAQSAADNEHLVMANFLIINISQARVSWPM